MPGDDGPDRDDDEPSRAGPIAAVLLLIGLAFAGLWLASVLRRQGAVEDCVMARRADCDALVR